MWTVGMREGLCALHHWNHERPHVAIFSSRRACLRLSCPIPPLVRAMPPAKYGRSASSGGTGAGGSQPLAGADPDLTPKHGIDGLVGDWLGWRKMFVVRAQTLSRTHTPRPQHKTDQRAWHTYRQLKEMELCSRGWISLPILANKRKHSESNTAGAQRRRNAKLLKYQETGRYGLNRR